MESKTGNVEVKVRETTDDVAKIVEMMKKELSPEAKEELTRIKNESEKEMKERRVEP